MDTATPSAFRRWASWAILAFLILGLAICLSVEPMRWRLPVRYLFKPLDIYRVGAFDYIMCIRVELSPEEAERFVGQQFKPEERVVRPVPPDQALCPGRFWPKNFTTQTQGYNVTHWPNGMVEGTTGAVYENGHLYFWSNTQ